MVGSSLKIDDFTINLLAILLNNHAIELDKWKNLLI
jgi:hypothetical protein